MTDAATRSRPFRLFCADRQTGETWAHAFALEERRDAAAADRRERGFVVLAWDVQRLPLEPAEVQPSSA